MRCVMFVFIYILLGGLFVFMLHRKIVHGPDDYEDVPPEGSHKLDELVGAIAMRGKSQFNMMDEAGG